jgi:type III secretion protein J
MASSSCSGSRDKGPILTKGVAMDVWGVRQQRKGSAFALLTLLAIVMLLLAGCSRQNLYANQSEQHANEMIAVLSENNIEAAKEAGEENSWTVTVSQGDFAKAVEILRARGLPREQFESTGTLFKPSGMSDTPLAQRARLIYAQEQELNRMISQFDGVVSAQVKLAMPEPDPLSQQAKPTSASVLVKHRTGFDLRAKTAAIKSLVANGVEGLNYDNVSVVIEPAQQLPVSQAADDGISFASLGRIIAGLLALFLFFIAIRALLRMRARRKQAVSTVPDGPVQ